VVVADEPLAAIDAPLRVDLLDRLREVATSTGAAVLMISHDPADVARIADQVAVLEDGRIVEQGAADEIWRRPRSATLVELLRDLPRLPDASTEEEPLGEPGPVLLRAEDVSRRYGRGLRSFEALKPLSLDLRGGETIAVVGPSGAGKSTLARCLCFHDRPTNGRLRVLGQDPCATSGVHLRRLRRRVQLVAQDAATAFNPRFSVLDAVMEPLLAFEPGTTTNRRDRVAALLEEVELSPALSSQRVTHLSGGERQRVALARALATDPQIMVLDEALSSLDLHSRARLIALLRRLQRNRGLAYVVVSHDLATVVEIADEILILEAGSAVERSSPQTLFRAPHHSQARRLVTAVQLLRRGLSGCDPCGF
jgi:peptide/nickel transport system ATP-binding protein